MPKKLVVMIIAVAMGCPAIGQVSTATLQGTVKDQTGAQIPGVSITVRNRETGAERTVLSDERGLYRVAQVSVGSYEVKGELLGFNTVIRDGITLTVAMQAVVDLVLTVGELRDEIRVVGEASQVQTVTSDVSELVDSKTIRELPLNGRNFVQLATLQAGVVFSDRARGGQVTTTGPGMKFNANGARDHSNSFLLDGQDIQDTFNSTPSSGGGETLGVDTLQEFEVKTANFSAEYSKAAGAVVNAVTKSGTNDIHGSAFAFHRNDNLDAANFFDNAFGRPKPEFRRNQFGATFGGPIVRNKTFYFGGYEGIREGQGFVHRFLVPSNDARAGRLRNSSTGQIQQINIAPAVRPYLETLFPLLPNGRDLGDGRAEHFTTRTNVKNDDFFVVKVDHRLANSDSFFVRYSFDEADLITPTGPIFAASSPSRNQYFAIQEQKIFSPNVVNTFKFGFNRSRLATEDIPLVDIPQSLNFVPGAPLIGNLGVSGWTSPGNSNLSPRQFIQNVFEVNDTTAITRGSHLLKFGGNVQRFQSNVSQGTWQFGSYSFGSIQGFLLGQPTSYTGPDAELDAVRGARQTLVGLFIQDDIKLNPRLTLNAGLRYEFITVPTEVNEKIANIRSLDATELSIGDPYYKNPSLLNFAPRIGFAWDVSGDSKTSVRSGFGIFHNQILPNQYRLQLVSNPPFAGSKFQTSPSFPDAQVRAPRRQTRDVFMVPFEPAQPAVYQWNLTLQRQLLESIVLSAGYVGTRGLHLPWGISGQDNNLAVPTIVDGRKFFAPNSARRNPAWGQIRRIDYNANSFYHALQLTIRGRTATGLQFQSSYTFSKSLDDASGIWGGGADFAGSPSPQDILDPRSERAPSGFDARHVLSTNFSYELPGLSSDSAIGTLLNGWQTTGIVSLSTGFPFTVLVDGASDRDRDLSRSAIRPDLVPGRSNNPVIGDPTRWFDASAFTLPAPGFYGNLGRNTLRADGFANVDFALLKNTRLTERISTQFRAELFNLFNHANFQIPAVRTIFIGGSSAPVLDAGQVASTANSARQIQLGLKFIW